MNKTRRNILQVDLANENQRDQLAKVARQRNWGLSLILVGWLHLVAFCFCYYLTVGENYHELPGYLLTWVGELVGCWVIFRLCGGPRPATLAIAPLESCLRRVWIAYFILAFNLGSMNTLRGHHMFEFFPAMASLASFAFIMMSVVIDWRYFFAVLIMFAAGLLMAAFFWHAFLIFALAWWLVLNAIGLQLWRKRPRSANPPIVATTESNLTRA
jgi:hypothetical protein